MKPYTTQLEGTWEEILAHTDELAGRRVRVMVFPDVDTAGSSTDASLLKYAGKWKGDDLLERLRDVYETRSPAEF